MNAAPRRMATTKQPSGSGKLWTIMPTAEASSAILNSATSGGCATSVARGTGVQHERLGAAEHRDVTRFVHQGLFALSGQAFSVVQSAIDIALPDVTR